MAQPKFSFKEGTAPGITSKQIIAQGRVRSQVIVIRIVGIFIGALTLAILIAFFFRPDIADKLFCSVGPFILAGVTGIIGLSAGKHDV